MEGKRGTAGAHHHTFNMELQPSRNLYRESDFRYPRFSNSLSSPGLLSFQQRHQGSQICPKTVQEGPK